MRRTPPMHYAGAFCYPATATYAYPVIASQPSGERPAAKGTDKRRLFDATKRLVCLVWSSSSCGDVSIRAARIIGGAACERGAPDMGPRIGARGPLNGCHRETPRHSPINPEARTLASIGALGRPVLGPALAAPAALALAHWQQQRRQHYWHLPIIARWPRRPIRLWRAVQTQFLTPGPPPSHAAAKLPHRHLTHILL